MPHDHTSRLMIAERLASIGGRLLEGPAWDPALGRVLFVDILGERLHTVDPDTGATTTIEVSDTCTAWIPRRTGGHAIAYRGGVRLTEPGAPGRTVTVVSIEADRPLNRTNDAKCDPAGRLWIGTMADDEADGAGTLYRLEATLECRSVLAPVTISNGLGWSPDATRMYYIDSPTRSIDVLDFDLETGTIGNRRQLVDTRPLAGVPDGLAVDRDGCLWVAFHDGAAVHRFAPDGALTDTVSLPVSRPTSCAFVSPTLSRLVITTAAAPDGTGGDLYALDPGVNGLPVAPFAG